jgi:radical SAM superfamily enzyme YgiQ (UPF0313 family)
MSTALLINPWIYDFAAFDLWACPLGLLYLGSILREGGWEVQYVDCTDRFHPAVADRLPPERDFHVGKYLATEVPKPEALKWVPRKFKRYGLPPEVVEKDLRNGHRPDVILVTSRMTYWYPGVVDAIRMCREVFPDVPVLLGGIYATLCRDHAREVCRPDLLIEGEGEPQLAVAIEEVTGKPLRLPDRLRGGALAEFENLPRPAYDLLKQTRALPIETSRGCPYHCTYCSSNTLTPKFRCRSPGRVVDEIEWAVNELGTEDFAFYDDALLMNHARHFEPIADELLRRNVRVRFHTPNSLFASMITPAVAEKLKAIGVQTVRISLESASVPRLKALNRRIYPHHFTKAMKNLRAAGFERDQIGVYLLCGLPGQSLDEVREAADFVIESGAVPRLAEYSPIPRTAEWPRAVTECPLPVDREPLLQNNSIFYMISGRLPVNELEGLKKYIWSRVRETQTPWPTEEEKVSGGTPAEDGF